MLCVCINTYISMWVSSAQVCFIVIDITSLKIFIDMQAKTDSVHMIYATSSLALVPYMSPSLHILLKLSSHSLMHCRFLCHTLDLRNELKLFLSLRAMVVQVTAAVACLSHLEI